jgi:hypothetical protein
LDVAPADFACLDAKKGLRCLFTIALSGRFLEGHSPIGGGDNLTAFLKYPPLLPWSQGSGE